MSTLDAAEAFSADEPGGPGGPERPLVPARVGELRGLIKDWRRGRATKTLWEAFHDAYVAVIAALMIGAMLINVVLKAQGTMSQCSSTTCLSARTVLPWAAFALAVALTLAASRLFGPVLASAAEGFWILDAPVNRKRLLIPRFAAALGLSLGVGAVIGALVSALTGAGPVAIAVWAGATGLAAMSAVAFAAAQQGREKHRLTQAAGFVFSLLGVAALLLVVGIAAEWFRLGLSTDVSVELGLIVIALAALVLAVSLVLALGRIPSMRRVRLTSGGSLIRGISGAFFALDIGLARDIVVARRAVEIGQVRPKRGRGVGLQAVIWREWQRLLRFPQPLLLVAGSVVVPYAADALGMSTLTPVLAGLTLFGATVGMLGGLRVLTRTGGLARCLPFTLAQLKLASIAIPAAVVALWAVLTTPAYLGFGDGAVTRDAFEAALMSTATGLAGLLAAVRWTQAKAVDFGAPMVSTQAGAFPPGLMTNLFRGFDVCLIVTAPMLLGFSPVWSLALGAIAALILLNSMDAETLRARQAEQQKRLAAEKRQREAQATATKQRKR
jgi:hypothetical protein